MHRPGLELTRLTPANVDDLLFDDVMWAQRAREEHDAFVAEAARQGRHRAPLRTQLLAEALDEPGAREFVQDELTTATRFGPALDAPLDELVGSTPGGRCSPSCSIGGVLKRDVAAGWTRPACCWSTCDADDFLLAPAAQPPVPAGQLRLGLRRAVDQPDGEAGPQARDDQLPAWSTTSTRCSRDADRLHVLLRQRRRRRTTRPPSRAATSSCIGNGAVMVGMGERTTPQGVEILARQYCSPHGAVDQGHRRRAAARRARSCTSTPR